MSTIAIKESYVDTLRLFGEVDELLDEAVEQYLIDRIVRRIKQTRDEVQAFEKLYGMDYAAFAERVQLDADYYNQVNQNNPLWEQDMLAWEYWDAEAREWAEKICRFCRDGTRIRGVRRRIKR